MLRLSELIKYLDRGISPKEIAEDWKLPRKLSDISSYSQENHKCGSLFLVLGHQDSLFLQFHCLPKKNTDHTSCLWPSFYNLSKFPRNLRQIGQKIGFLGKTRGRETFSAFSTLRLFVPFRFSSVSQVWIPRLRTVDPTSCALPRKLWGIYSYITTIVSRDGSLFPEQNRSDKTTLGSVCLENSCPCSLAMLLAWFAAIVATSVILMPTYTW